MQLRLLTIFQFHPAGVNSHYLSIRCWASHTCVKPIGPPTGGMMTQRTSPAYLGYALKLAQTISELHLQRSASEGLRTSAAIEDMLSGLLTLGILLVRSKPHEMLKHWVEQSRSLNDATLLAVLERLQTGLLLTTDAAAREAAAFGSRDTLVNCGAALNVCQSDEAGARDVVIASLRIAGALNSGLALSFKGSLHPPVSRLLASRLSLQLRRPNQFSMPYLAIPVIAQTVRQVVAEDAGIRELLTVGCQVTGVNAEAMLRQI